MKGFKKLLLTSAILAASSSAIAMQAMDEEALSSTTGQDGITINLDVDMQDLNITYIDRDGIGGDFAGAGGVLISPIGITANDQTITIDAGGSAGDTTGLGQLRIGMVANGTTVIDLGGTEISVADANSIANGGGSALGATTAIVSFDATASLTIAAGASMTMLLGNRTATYTPGVAATAGTPDGDLLTDGADGDGILDNDADQGFVAATPAVAENISGDHMISIVSSIPSITLTGLRIHDAVGTGQIGIGTIAVDNVNTEIGVDVIQGGLRVDTTGTTIGSIGLENIKVGGALNLANRSNSIGDLYITSSNPAGIIMNNVITITGH
ncbi:MAG: protein FilA [Moraxellaceae bacterium]|jgi:hypothetical protein|nr:protein FilA [Moraxellaceae bacterium]